ncbi:ATP-binding SpoIIE family protein phosphatase [Streptomyces liangshanensis]|uniref:ATP-binding SpoIIE family protein phosphatase n=1 Tax=Streptomyces liangshanensis TaxID=2717324 RepID=UPI001FB91839|nr:SpoIIE family protein phosphatase [Streptomyces liangshanensis]
MSSVRRGKMGVFVVLLVFVALLSFAQVPTSHDGVIRLGGFSVLAPLVASALLSFRQTLVICGATMVGILVVYGGVSAHLPAVQRIVTITLVTAATAISVVVCRIRLEREERITRLMFARDRLTLLTDAGVRVGSTLDTARTAQELADVAVPRFADLAVVDLFDTVLHGDEPPPLPASGPITLRRVARGAAGGRGPETAGEPGGLHAYPPDSVPGRSLALGRATRARIDGGSGAAGWPGPATGPAARAHRHHAASGIAVPLRARGVTLGLAVFVRDARAEPFDDDDLLLAEEIGARAAVCVDNARRYSREHRTSLKLQQSLLPKRLPELAAVETASRYLPAGSVSEMGGDWFDVIRLSGSRVGLVVGDVLGHGLQASATMGRLRSAVRTLADMDLSPDELLTHLDDVLGPLRAESDEGDEGDTAGATGATCLYAVYDPVALTCTLARAGHPAPVLVLPDGGAAFVDVPEGPPLGVGGLPFEATEVRIPEGSLLALFTNGLLSAPRRDDGRDPRDALRSALAAPRASLDATCEAVLAAMLDGGPADDIALLLARTHALGAGQVATWDVPADPRAVGGAREFATGQLETWGLADAAFTIELVVSELVTNAIRYGSGPIQLRLIREDGVICEVSDRSSVSPHLRRARSDEENGRGLFIIAQLTERWGTRYTRAGKTIWAEIPL